MNKFIFTGKIISRPQLFIYNNRLFIQILVGLQNTKKYKLVYYVKTHANGIVSNKIFYNYKVGSFIIVESSIKIKRQLISLPDKNKRIQKEIFIKIDKIYSNGNIS